MLGLFVIAACYVTAIVLLHAYGRHLSRRKANKPSHVVLITKNNQSQIEWYIRSLYFFCKLKGRHIDATVLDEGSTDDTLHIVERLSLNHPMHIESHEVETVDDFLKRHKQENVIIVRLHQQEDMAKWLQLQQ